MSELTYQALAQKITDFVYDNANGEVTASRVKELLNDINDTFGRKKNGIVIDDTLTKLVDGDEESLNSIITTTLSTGTNISLIVNNITHTYQLVSGTAEESVPGIIRPLDFELGVNEQIWVLIPQLINFLSISDVPSSYTSQALKIVRVNSAEDALEFVNLVASLVVSEYAPQHYSVDGSHVDKHLKGIDDTLAIIIANGKIPNSWVADASAVRTLIDYAEGDDIGRYDTDGVYEFDPAETAADDGATYLKPTNIDTGDPGRWVRQKVYSVSGHTHTPGEVGLGNVTNDAQLKRASGDFDEFGAFGGTLANARILVEDQGSGKAKGYLDASALAGNVNNGAATGQMVIWNNTSSKYEPTSNIIWDNSSQVLKLKGSGSIGATNVFELRNSSDALNFWIKDDGSIYLGASGSEYARIKANSTSIIVGLEAGRLLTTAQSCTILGSYAGWSNIASNNNTLLGTYAGYNLIGSESTFVGRLAGASTTTGSGNVAVGDQALDQNQTGSYSTAVGYLAGYWIRGSHNISLGAYSGMESTSTPTYGAITGDNNILLGQYTGAFLSSGSGNIFMGYLSGGYSVGRTAGITGVYNVAIGANTLGLTTSGSYNLVQGHDAGHSLTEGNYNVFLGHKAGYSETTGSNKLYISNSDTTNPLIYGEFDNGWARINGELRIANAGSDKMLIRTDGTIQPASLADSSAPNDSIYYSTDQTGLVYKDPGGTVNTLY